VDYEGELFGQKDVEFLKLIRLPAATEQPLELALSGSEPSVVNTLRDAGWSVLDAANVSADVDGLQAYIAGSRAEFSAAKNAYVKTNSGWFSDRTVCYLAAGKPAVLQSTGLRADCVPTGEGVVTFTNLQEAAAGIERVNSAYGEHCRAALRLADETFSYKHVLPRLLELAMASRTSAAGPG
jgi:hypothetical protein